MSIKDHTIFEHKRSNDFYRAPKKAVLKNGKMKDKVKNESNKRVKVLLKFIQKNCDKNPEVQEMIDASMIEVCAEEGVSPEQIFFILLFLCCCRYHNGYSRKKIKTRVFNGNSSGNIKSGIF